MKILNPAVWHDLDEGRPIRLNLGSGQRQRPGFYNVDCVPLPNVDILADLEEPLSEFPDDSVEEIYCRHVLEHVDNFLELLAEMHRVTVPDGRMEIVVPHFSNPYGYSDPTHVRFFGLYSFFYFANDADQPRRRVPNFYLPQRFRIENIRFNLIKTGLFDKVVRAVLQPVINRGIGWLDWYERRLCRLLPTDDVHYVLRPVKSVVESFGPDEVIGHQDVGRRRNRRRKQPRPTAKSAFVQNSAANLDYTM